MKNRKFYGLRFIMTCDACPEQYDVFDVDNKPRGYVRLRHGILSCHYPMFRDGIIYLRRFQDEWKGCFDDEKETVKYLKRIAGRIRKEIRNANR